MKIFSSICLFITLFFTANISYSFNRNINDNKSHLTVEQKKEILNYFSEILANNSKKYNIKVKISPDEINNYTKEIWEIWKEANKNFNEEKLIELSDLKNKKKDKWNIPADLEPNAVLNYILGSQNGDEKTKYPLYIILHGSGEKNREWSNMQIFCSRFNIGEAAYFIPQIPNTGKYYRWWQKSKQYIYEKLLRQAFVSEAFNPNKIFFSGYSEGAYGSQRLASFYADYIAGAGPAAGGEPLANAPAENCSNIAFTLRTGSKDYMFCRHILTQNTKDAFDSLQSVYPNYFNHKIDLVPDAEHSINYNPTLEYLKDFTRNPYPKFVCWENYPMDGIFRTGFYNIVNPENLNKKNSENRTYIKMNIVKNTINLTISEVEYNVTLRDSTWGIPLKFNKTYFPIKNGSIKLFLCDELVDLSKPIIIKINGKKVYKKKVKPSLASLVNSCAMFFDPMRIYPALVEVKW